MKNVNLVPLGSTVRDVITGFEGTVISYTQYLTGCDCVGVRPAKLTKEGKPAECSHFDVTQVKIMKSPSAAVTRVLSAKLPSGKPTNPGGPQEAPPER